MLYLNSKSSLFDTREREKCKTFFKILIDRNAFFCSKRQHLGIELQILCCNESIMMTVVKNDKKHYMLHSHAQ